MEKKLARLRRRLEQARAGGSRHCPKALRDEIVAAAHAWREAGGRRAEAIEKLGIKPATYDWWLRRDREQTSAVKVVELIGPEESEGEKIAAHLGCGVRVEGLTIEDVIALARGLS